MFGFMIIVLEYNKELSNKTLFEFCTSLKFLLPFDA